MFLGKISEEDLAPFDVQVRNYLISNEHKFGIKENIHPSDVWRKKFPEANELALDLLGRLLTFNAKKRITVKEAIAHEYFREITSLETPPVASVKFNWDWEYKNTKLLSSIPFVKKLIYMES